MPLLAHAAPLAVLNLVAAWSDCGSDDPTYCYRFDYDDAQVNLTWIVRICNASDVDRYLHTTHHCHRCAFLFRSPAPVAVRL